MTARQPTFARRGGGPLLTSDSFLAGGLRGRAVLAGHLRKLCDRLGCMPAHDNQGDVERFLRDLRDFLRQHRLS
jgi:hypothetical protein